MTETKEKPGLTYVLSSLSRTAKDSLPYTLYPVESGILLQEIERLRGERHLDNEALAHAWDESRDMERAAVVAWLYRDGCEASAERIERGEHRCGEEK
jgi:hypothetical protein